MITEDMYERAPDGAQWPATLLGLQQALDDSIMAAQQHPDVAYNLNRVHAGGTVRTIRTFVKGEML